MKLTNDELTALWQCALYMKNNFASTSAYGHYGAIAEDTVRRLQREKWSNELGCYGNADFTSPSRQNDER